MGRVLAKYLGYPYPLVGVSQPDIRPIGRRAYRLVEVFVVRAKLSGDADDLAIEVPAGFELDGASVPRLVWTLSGLTPDGLIRAAALVHDYLYQHQGHLPGTLSRVSRAASDQLFLDLMLAAGVGNKRARLAYRAVRMFARRW